MSQNQSYFWQTTRRNVYLKRTSKLQMLLAMMAVLTFATICVAEIGVDPPTTGPVAKIDVNEKELGNSDNFDVAADEIPNSDATKSAKSRNSFVDAFSASISVILFTELGDKTFFIAAIMAMRHPRLIVFAGAISALALMTILSVVFGMAATIIPKIYTYYISTALFAIFGLKMIYEGYFMKATDAQEELEEVQTSLRKREDELLRSTRTKFDESDAKRKNSNSDKEDAGIERGAGAAHATPSGAAAAAKNPEMQHRQRKQFNHNNNKNSNSNSIEDSDDADLCNENDVFLQGETVKMSTFHHSSPALSSIKSNQTEQTNCDEFNNSAENLTQARHNRGIVDPAAMIHSASASASQLAGKTAQATISAATSVNSIKSLNSAAAVTGAGQPNGELKQLGGSKKRLERDVSATLIQDPESGILRKNTKKSATYLTTRVLMQAFTMTFLAEWGDRSQLTTIILAASKDVYGVIAGGIIGHSICTGLAVIGGRMVAAKISVRTVTILGGIVFLGFALYALIVRPDDI